MPPGPAGRRGDCRSRGARVPVVGHPAQESLACRATSYPQARTDRPPSRQCNPRLTRGRSRGILRHLFSGEPLVAVPRRQLSFPANLYPETRRETDLQAESAQARAHARLPRAPGDSQRPQGIAGQACQGPRSAQPLTGPTEHRGTLGAPVPGAPTDGAFPRSRRLVAGTDFSAVFARPIRSADRHFSVLARLNDASATPPADPDAGGSRSARLGLAISRKCARRAVDRNRIKRIVRESFRLACWDDCPIDIVVLCRAPAARAANRTLFEALSRHWCRLRQLACEDPRPRAG